MRTSCPDCGSKRFVKNGVNKHFEQNHLCKDCGRQFVLDPICNQIGEQTKDLVSKLLLERLSLEGICRVTGVSQTWLMGYLTELYSLVPDDLNLVIPQDVQGVFLTRVEADEIWSFVGHKGNRQWIWLALDITTRQVIACHVGGRVSKDATSLWNLIPEIYKNDADFYTDQLEAYREAIPEELHYACKKKVAKQV